LTTVQRKSYVHSKSSLTRIQSCILNRLDPRGIGRKKLAGIIGGTASRYAKSPSIWNSTFQALGMEAIYLPFDVEEARLSALVQALKESPQFIGANVTVPYKIKIIEYLDGLDKNAQKIGAVNTIVRTPEGLLKGYNTDGSGFVESLLARLPGEPKPFLKSLNGMDTLIIGSGGSARAVAFHLAEDLGAGQLFICNRTEAAARSLASDVKRVFPRVSAIPEKDLPDAAQRVGLIVNCSTKGQGATQSGRDGKSSFLEPYSALAPANPIRTRSAGEDSGFYREWLRGSLADIEANNHLSWKLALSIPVHVALCDLIYFPAETVFLRHGRLSGHRTLNGKGMNVAQATEAFFHRISRDDLKRREMHDQRTYKRIFQIMYEAW
jgi:shikimate dehydrogenase